MKAIFKREFKSYFNDLTGFIFVGFSLFFLGLFVTLYNLTYLNSHIAYALSDMMLIIAILIPIVSLRSVLEERKNGSYRLLCSLPLKPYEVVLGKYAAFLALFAIPAAVAALMPLFFNFFGEVNFAASYASILCFFLFGAALIAVCTFISSVVNNPIIALVISYIVLVLLFVVNSLTSLIPAGSVWGNILSFVAFFGAYDSFIYEMLDIRAIVYYMSVTVFFVFMSVRSFDKKSRE